jgi:hypothetical protein
VTTSRNPPGGPPTVAEIASLTARLRELTTPGRAADPAERAAFLADKDALLARIADTQAAIPRQRATREDADRDDARASDDQVVSARQAVARIVAAGYPRRRAEQLVRGYLDRASADVGVPVHTWGLDRHDFDALICTAESRPVDPGPQSRAGAGGDPAWEMPARIREHARRADAELDARPGAHRGHLRIVATEPEEQRREELIRWHRDDHAPGEHDAIEQEDGDARHRDGEPR